MPRTKLPAAVAAIGLVPAVPPASPRLESLISKLDQEYDDIKALEVQLSEANARAQDLAENVIPEVMANDGVDEFTVSYKPDVIRLKDSYHASITREHKEEAHRWLEATNADMLKDQVIISFGLKEYAEATMCRHLLGREFPDHTVDTKRTVPGSTLVAFVKRMLESGANWPAELFGAYHKRTVVLPWHKPVKLTATDDTENAD